MLHRYFLDVGDTYFLDQPDDPAVLAARQDYAVGSFWRLEPTPRAQAELRRRGLRWHPSPAGGRLTTTSPDEEDSFLLELGVYVTDPLFWLYTALRPERLRYTRCDPAQDQYYYFSAGASQPYAAGELSQHQQEIDPERVNDHLKFNSCPSRAELAEALGFGQELAPAGSQLPQGLLSVRYKAGHFGPSQLLQLVLANSRTRWVYRGPNPGYYNQDLGTMPLVQQGTIRVEQPLPFPFAYPRPLTTFQGDPNFPSADPDLPLFSYIY